MRCRIEIQNISYCLIHHQSLNKGPFLSSHTLHSSATFIVKRSPRAPNILRFYLISQQCSASLDFASTIPLQDTLLSGFRTWLNGVLQLRGVLLHGSKGIRYAEFVSPFSHAHSAFASGSDTQGLTYFLSVKLIFHFTLVCKVS